jgi:hypothetical protein
MNYTIYGHHHGDIEVPEPMRLEVRAALDECSVPVARGNAPVIRDNILQRLMASGWPPEVEIDPSSKISVTSVKRDVALCLQTGNMSRMYADLLKLQTLYLRESTTASVLILPTGDAARELGDNVASFDRLLRELPIFGRIITVPIMVIGFGE